MFGYHPDQEVDSDRVILLSVDASSGYGHVNARIVRRVKGDVIDPDTGNRKYNDGEHDLIGFRNCSWSSTKKNALFIEDYVLRNQFHTTDDSSAYGVSGEFKNVYSVNQREAECMLNTFKKLEKERAKIAVEFGHSTTLAEEILRLAKILGIKKFVVPKNISFALCSKDFREFNAGDVAREIKQLEDSVRQT